MTVDGSFVRLNVIHKDISDNNITLNSFGHPANGGGITILDNQVGGVGNHGLTWLSTPAIHGSQNYWDTSGADISTNNLFANKIIAQNISGNDASFNDISAVNLFISGDISFNGHVEHGGDISTNDISCVTLFAHHGLFNGDISANDASFNDISAVNFYGNTYTTTGHSRFHDISGTDASFVDISAVNFFSVGNSFFGDIHATGTSSFNDLSGNDASFNDISASAITIIGTKLYVNGKTFTFPNNSGALSTTGGGAGSGMVQWYATGDSGDTVEINAQSTAQISNLREVTLLKLSGIILIVPKK